MELISMVDFILKESNSSIYIRHMNNKTYAAFLKQPLKLEMFVPCDEEGKVLAEPYWLDDRYIGEGSKTAKLATEYEKAETKVVFKNFKYNHIQKEAVCYKPSYCVIDIYLSNHKTVEDLVEYNLQLKV